VPYVERSFNPDGSLATVVTFDDAGTLTVTDASGAVLLQRAQTDAEKLAVAHYNADVTATAAENKLPAARSAVAADRLAFGSLIGTVSLVVLGQYVQRIQDLLLALTDSETGEDR
jgi:hypothetical protein